MKDFNEIKISISGEDVMRYDLNDLCSGSHEVSFDLIYKGWDNVELQIENTAITLPAEKLRDVLSFLNQQIAKSSDSKVDELAANVGDLIVEINDMKKQYCLLYEFAYTI